MKQHIHSLSLALSLSVAGFLVTGCGTPKAVKSTESAVSTMADIERTLESASGQITVVMSSLKGIEEAVNHDPRKAYNNFTSEVAKLDKLAEESRKQGEKMRARADEHYKMWQNELANISNTELRVQSEARRVELVKEFDGLKESIDGLKLAFKPFLSDMKDLQSFFATDLTASGYTAAESIISELKSEAVYVQRQLKAVVDKIKSLRGSMATVQAPQ